MTTVYIVYAVVIHILLHPTLSAINCGQLIIKCNTGDTGCYSGPCASIATYLVGFNMLPPPLPISNTTTDPISDPTPYPTPNPTPNPTSTLTPSPPPITSSDSCDNTPPCPCTHLQCFKQRVAPNCECECPLEIIIKDAIGTPNICGIDNPGQIYISQACGCQCPPHSLPVNGCGLYHQFNPKTCQCDPIPSATHKPTFKPTPKPTPKPTLKPTAKPTTTAIPTVPPRTFQIQDIYSNLPRNDGDDDSDSDSDSDSDDDVIFINRQHDNSNLVNNAGNYSQNKFKKPIIWMSTILFFIILCVVLPISYLVYYQYYCANKMKRMQFFSNQYMQCVLHISDSNESESEYTPEPDDI